MAKFMRVYSLYITEDDGDSAFIIDKCMIGIQDKYTYSRAQALKKIFLHNSEQLLKELELSPKDAKDVADSLMRIKIKERLSLLDSDKRSMSKFISSLGSDRVATEVSLLGGDAQGIINDYMPPQSQGEIMRLWLVSLFADGKERVMQDVINQAVEERIIADPSISGKDAEEYKDGVNFMRVIANKMNLTSRTHRGMWGYADSMSEI